MRLEADPALPADLLTILPRLDAAGVAMRTADATAVR
jgi:hypothetical protein